MKERQMMKSNKSVVAAFAAAVLIGGLYGCEKPKEGPMERAGKKVDNAMDNAGKHVERAGERIRDAAKGDDKK